MEQIKTGDLTLRVRLRKWDEAKELATTFDETISKLDKQIGKLKEIAKQYSVTYPTVRLRLDKLIQKIQMTNAPS